MRITLNKKDTLTTSSDYDSHKAKLLEINEAIENPPHKEKLTLTMDGTSLNISYKDLGNGVDKSIDLSSLKDAKEATEYLDNLKECEGFVKEGGEIFAKVIVADMERKIPIGDLNSSITFERAKAREETKEI